MIYFIVENNNSQEYVDTAVNSKTAVVWKNNFFITTMHLKLDFHYLYCVLFIGICFNISSSFLHLINLSFLTGPNLNHWPLNPRHPKPHPLQKKNCNSSATTVTVYYIIKVKVKWSRYRLGVAQRVGRGIALLFHDRGTRRRWVVSSTPRPPFNPGKDPVPILQEAGWAPGPVWTGGKSRPHRDSIPDRPARSQSLLYYRRIKYNIVHYNILY